MIKKLLYSILAGITISLGCIVYILCENKIAGALLFSIGIMAVIEFKLNLVTGFIPTKRDQYDKFYEYIIDTLFIFCGNLIGTIITSLLVKATRISDKVYQGALAISQAKVDDKFWSIFILAIFCGFIIALIVKAKDYKYRVLYVAFMIATFILSSFEHVVADGFYLSMSNLLYTWKGLLVLLMALLGNFLGGFLSSFIGWEKKKNEANLENIEENKEQVNA